MYLPKHFDQPSVDVLHELNECGLLRTRRRHSNGLQGGLVGRCSRTAQRLTHVAVVARDGWCRVERVDLHRSAEGRATGQAGEPPELPAGGDYIFFLPNLRLLETTVMLDSATCD